MTVSSLIISIIAIVVGVVGIVVGLPPLLRMIYGRPQPKVFFDSSKGYKLWCWIRNIPVKNAFLIWLGVKRRSIEFDTTITITDKDDDIVSWLPYARTSSNDMRIGIVEVKSRNDRRVFLKDEDDKYSHKILEVGLYKVVVELHGDERELLKESKQFRVNATYPFAEWIEQ
jgi:hypothetical protein